MTAWRYCRRRQSSSFEGLGPRFGRVGCPFSATCPRWSAHPTTQTRCQRKGCTPTWRWPGRSHCQSWMEWNGVDDIERSDCVTWHCRGAQRLLVRPLEAARLCNAALGGIVSKKFWPSLPRLASWNFALSPGCANTDLTAEGHSGMRGAFTDSRNENMGKSGPARPA